MRAGRENRESVVLFSEKAQQVHVVCSRRDVIQCDAVFSSERALAFGRIVGVLESEAVPIKEKTHKQCLYVSYSFPLG